MSAMNKFGKKARQIYRKNQEKFFGEMIKPKPKWIPWKLWVWGLGRFIRIEETQKK